MTRTVRIGITLALVVAAVGAAVGAAGCGASGSSLADIGAGVRGPKNLTASVYANGPTHVAAFAIDGQGRLWLATAGYDDSSRDGVYLVAKQGAAPVEVVSGLHTPLGLLWRGAALYVASTGKVEVFRDLRGTRFASRRTIVRLPAEVGESNGLVAAPDGRILLGISAPCDHCTPASKWSGAIVSFRADGSDLQVYARGIRAPIALEYYPGTSNLLVTMNQRDDLGAQTPGDWLALVRSGDNWRFPGCYGQGGRVCIGVRDPVAVLDRHAAAAGLAILLGQLGAAAGPGALVAEWAKGTVLRVSLDRSGTRASGHATPFLTGIHNPVALLLTPEGHLLVGDWTTGRIYEISAR
jgi:glucose/arabinose dehydrogenase